MLRGLPAWSIVGNAFASWQGGGGNIPRLRAKRKLFNPLEPLDNAHRTLNNTSYKHREPETDRSGAKKAVLGKAGLKDWGFRGWAGGHSV